VSGRINFDAANAAATTEKHPTQALQIMQPHLLYGQRVVSGKAVVKPFIILAIFGLAAQLTACHRGEQPSCDRVACRSVPRKWRNQATCRKSHLSPSYLASRRSGYPHGLVRGGTGSLPLLDRLVLLDQVCWPTRPGRERSATCDHMTNLVEDRNVVICFCWNVFEFKCIALMEETVGMVPDYLPPSRPRWTSHL
jgi:hypothetical protein